MQGYVEAIGTRPTPRGTTAYNIKIGGNWVGAGFDKPPCEKGDTIEYETSQRGQYLNLVPGSLKVISKAASGGTSSSTPSGTTTDSRQNSIVFQSSRNAAIQLAGIALQHDCLPLPAKKADKYDALLSIVDDLTIKMYYDHENMEEFLSSSSPAGPVEEVDELDS